MRTPIPGRAFHPNPGPFPSLVCKDSQHLAFPNVSPLIQFLTIMFDYSEAFSPQTRSCSYRDVTDGFCYIYQEILQEVARQSEERRLDRAIEDKETATYHNHEGMLIVEAFPAFVDFMENALRNYDDKTTKARNDFFGIRWGKRDLSGRPV
jgi:hypothetical protein